MDTKVCGRCKLEKPLTEFYLHKRDGHRSRCKPCHSLDMGEYYKRPEVKERRNAWMRKYTKEYFSRPEVRTRLKAYRERSYVKAKNYARNCINAAIRLGKICREPCAVCGKEQGQAHHLDYNEPLMIVWLCSNCHRRLHKQLLEG